MKVIKNYLSKITFALAVSLIVGCSPSENNQSGTEKTANYTDVELFKSIFFGVGEFAVHINQLKSKIDLTNNLKGDKRVEVVNKLDLLVKEIKTKNPSFFPEFKQLITSGDQRKVQLGIELGSTMIKENFEVIFPELKKVFHKVKSDIYTGKLKLNKQDSFKTYIETFQTAIDKGEYDSLLKKNMITDENETVVPCTWAVACVAYFAIAAHNTVAVTALIYFKFAFYGPSIDSGNQVTYDGAINCGLDCTGMDYIGPDDITPPGPIVDPEEATLRTETLVNEIAEYYAEK
ncbi:hypothetical protein [Flavobacterium humidisoli]|uniref:Antimicrobial peptide, SdpC family n=1 Tax=Flavobacterium humidisoli TaxID=2937442 RepID=A0ABY4LRE3_9FLAO|nr:hypothetical protein [Flavobacterium humidisoli]UPZ14833.1 hypothetical protein M0M44_18980 [Flavobacterium humidisoli]